MNQKEKRINREIINPGKTEKLQKDWRGYGKAYAYYGLVVLRRTWNGWLKHP